MARPRRDVADSGLAFLDVVSCGFGAVILLLIITKSVAPQDTRASAEGLAGDAATLQAAVLSAQARRDELRDAAAEAQARVEALKQQLAAQQDAEVALQVQAQRAADALADAQAEGRALEYGLLESRALGSIDQEGANSLDEQQCQGHGKQHLAHQAARLEEPHGLVAGSRVTSAASM